MKFSRNNEDQTYINIQALANNTRKRVDRGSYNPDANAKDL